MSTSATSPAMTQDEILGKLYRDMARLAAEIALDRCRNRVLLNLVKARLGLSDEELDTMFRAEMAAHLAPFTEEIVRPMIAELEEPEAPSGCCGGGCA